MLSKHKQKKIALERIHVLFAEAKKVHHSSPALAQRYVTLARKLSMKYKVPFPQAYKKLFCKMCHSFLQPGSTVRIRLRNKVLVYYCNVCQTLKRYPVK